MTTYFAIWQWTHNFNTETFTIIKQITASSIVTMKNNFLASKGVGSKLSGPMWLQD